MEFKDIVKKRYATKKFDGKKIPQEKFDELLEIIRMSASSFGLQPWKIKIIEDEELKEKLFPVSRNQQQIITCSHLLVFCADLDIKSHINRYCEIMRENGIPEEKIEKTKNSMTASMEKKDEAQFLNWAQRQVYLAVGNAINGAKSLGFDSCPMEGFEPEGYSKVLELPNNLLPSTLVTVGYAADEPKKKLRFSREDMFF